MRSEERAHNERLANDRYREAGRDKHPLRSLRSLLFCILYFSCFIALVSCHYSRPNLEDEHLSKETRDSLAYLFERHYTWNTNLEVLADSVNLACLPVKDCYNMLYRGDRVVVAEFAIHPADSVDSVWVKLAHSQEVQGWLRESEMMHAFVPTDSISQAIYLFSDTHASYFIIIFALFVAVWLFRAFRRKQLRMVYFNDIDSLYPLLLCLLMAFCATIYESIQVFAPETWQHFYFNPTLSPFKVPLVLSAFLMGIWLFIGGTRRFVSPVKSGGGRILSVGAGLLLHLLLFLLYPDYIYLRRILVFDRFCMGIPQKASHFAAGFTLSLRQMRAETEGEGSLPTLRSYQ